MPTPTVPMTVQDILDMVYVNVDDDPTSSTNTDDEQTARIRLINAGIRSWEREDVLWRQLWKNTGSLAPITTSNTISLSGITDYRHAGSLLYLTDPNNSANVQFIDIIDPTQAIKYVQNATQHAAFITGNPAIGWTLNLTWTPTTSDSVYGFIPSFYYYKSANRVSATTDVPEMGDPDYLVWYVTAQKHLFNNRTDMAQDAMGQAGLALDNMKIKNMLLPNYADNSLEDIEVFRYNDSLGL